MTESLSERKFNQLKKRLESLNYTQTLGVESVPLCERILNDLIKITEGFQGLKRKNDDLKNLNDQSLIELEHLKSQTSKNSLESNNSRKEILHLKEVQDKAESQFRISIKRLEAENSDYKSLLSQKDLLIKTLN